MQIRNAVFGLWASVTSLGLPIAVQAQVMEIPPGFDFPAAATFEEGQKILEGFRDANDIGAMRRHGWMLWAGMTQPAPGGEALWETWHRSGNTFRPAGAAPQSAGLMRDLRAPRQFNLSDGAAAPQAAGASLLSEVLFNDAAHRHIRQHSLFSQTELARINNQFPPVMPFRDRMLDPEFPHRAVALKVVWWPVKASGKTAMPVWDFDPANRYSPSTPNPSNPRFSWKRVVAIDPSRATIPAGETASIEYIGEMHDDARVVSADAFYKVTVTPQLAAAAQTNGRLRGAMAEALGGRPLEAGDYLVLAAFHFTTKEIPNWVWGTFWWHDEPQAGPFARDRVVEVKDVWRNYLMDVNYDFDDPREFDGSPDAVMNPWLEAGFQNGLASNCMACHGRAVFPAVAIPGLPPHLPVTRGENDAFYDAQVFPSPGTDPAYDGRRMRTDFLWSLIFESQP